MRTDEAVAMPVAPVGGLRSGPGTARRWKLSGAPGCAGQLSRCDATSSSEHWQSLTKCPPLISIQAELGHGCQMQPGTPQHLRSALRNMLSLEAILTPEALPVCVYLF